MPVPPAQNLSFPDKKIPATALLWYRTTENLFQPSKTKRSGPPRAKDMFDTFSRCHIPPENQMDKRFLRRCHRVQEGFKLWFARRLDWPLQEIPFEALVGTPRSLSALEKILLHICLTLDTDPPDSLTIARELAIHDPAFIDETLRDLANLGAVERTPDGHSRITDLGIECHSRGQLPVKTRRQAVSLFFDPIAGDFPDDPATVAPRQQDAKGNADGALDADFPLARAERISLDTLRRVVRSQGTIAQDKDTVIFAAEPTGSHPTAAGQTGTSPTFPTTQGDGGISWRQVCLLVFRSSRGEIRLQVCDPSLQPGHVWFQRVLETRLQEDRIDWGHLLGPLLISTTAPQDNGSAIASAAPEPIGLSALAVHEVRKKVLEVIALAKDTVLMQAQGLPGNGTAILSEVICQAAQRGAHCHLLWDNQVPAGAWRWAPIHNNIQHRLSSAVSQEFLVADRQALVGSAVCRGRPWIGSASLSLLLAGCSQEHLTCQAAEEKFLDAWEQGRPVENGQLHPPALVAVPAAEYRSQSAEPQTLGGTHTFKKETCQ